MDNTKEAQDAKEEGIPDRIFIGNSYEKYFEQKGKHYPWEFIRADLVPQWIKCSERMPEENRVVMIYCAERRNTYMAHWSGSLNGIPHWYYWGAYGVEVHEPVTHWRERPQYPTEDV